MEKELTLDQKISRVQFESMEVKKSGKNNMGGGYNYKTFTDIKKAVMSSMLKYELYVIFDGMVGDYTITNIGNMKQIEYTAQFKYGDAKESRTITFPVLGINTDISKANGSAITYALKYIFNLLFLIPDETLDPDHNNQNKVSEGTKNQVAQVVVKRNFKEELKNILRDDSIRLEISQYLEVEDALEKINDLTPEQAQYIRKNYLEGKK